MAEHRNEFDPDTVSPPGETLLELLVERGMSQSELSDRVGRPRKTINEIVKGKAGITAETALQLETVLGAPASFWSNRQRQYDEFVARNERRKKLRPEVRWLKQIPVREMMRRGFLRKFADELEMVSECLRYFGVASVPQWEKLYLKPQGYFRKSARLEDDNGATAAWIREGEIVAQRSTSAEFDRDRFMEALTVVRGFTRITDPTTFIPLVQKLCAQCGVTVVFIPEYPGSVVGGAARWLSPSRALIQLASRYARADILWFNFFHEAAHIAFHKKKTVFLDVGLEPGDTSEANEAAEREANEFARNLLIPKAKYEAFVRAKLFGEPAIRTFAGEVDVATGTILGRLQADGHVDHGRMPHLLDDLVLPNSAPEFG